MNQKLIFLIILSLTFCIESFSESRSTERIEFGGYLDFYYQTSPQGHSAIPATLSGPRVIEGRYFDRQTNQMNLNMAEVSLKQKSGKTTFKIDIATGEMVDQLNGGGSHSVTAANPINMAANEPTRNITQAILSYSVSDRATISLGKFYTHMGLEVTKAKDNWQYSRSYTYNYGIPFWHQGVSLNYLLYPDTLSASFYLLNAWDGRVSQEQNQATSVGANLNYFGTKNLILNYNYIGGAEAANGSHRQVQEINAVYRCNDRISIAIDYIYGQQAKIPGQTDVRWSSFTVSVKAQINDM